MVSPRKTTQSSKPGVGKSEKKNQIICIVNLHHCILRYCSIPLSNDCIHDLYISFIVILLTHLPHPLLCYLSPRQWPALTRFAPTDYFLLFSHRLLPSSQTRTLVSVLLQNYLLRIELLWQTIFLYREVRHNVSLISKLYSTNNPSKWSLKKSRTHSICHYQNEAYPNKKLEPMNQNWLELIQKTAPAKRKEEEERYDKMASNENATSHKWR